MSIICPNKIHPDFIRLSNIRGENIAYYLFVKHEGEVPDSEYRTEAINYALKSVDILSSDKAKQVFEKGNKNNWTLDKILTELQIPKEQKEIINSLSTDNREDIITSLLANYSYSVEVNTAKQIETKYGSTTWNAEDNQYEPNFDEPDNITELNAQYYSNLTVPGGTNYTENEIATPAITPSIKGHAQFSTDKGIGWFRSSDRIVYTDLENVKELLKSSGQLKIDC